MNDLLSHKKQNQKSTQAKVAENILGILQAVSYVFALLFFFRLMGEVLRDMGVEGDNVGTYVWGITIVLAVFVGWLLELKKK